MSINQWGLQLCWSSTDLQKAIPKAEMKMLYFKGTNAMDVQSCLLNKLRFSVS